jgi:hypothetical protein
MLLDGRSSNKAHCYLKDGPDRGRSDTQKKRIEEGP